MSNHTLPNPAWTAGYPESGPARVRLRLRLALGRLSAMLAARRQRGELTELDDRTLQDIGVSRADVEREANRPFWDITP